MTYILENKEEAARLERQARERAYSVEAELQDWEIRNGWKVLDAGCGSGLAARHLAERFPKAVIEACDFSDIRVHEAEKLKTLPAHHRIRFFRQDLTTMGVPDRTYDAALCRFVLEHLKDPAQVVAELFRILRPGGQLRVIDIDGLIFNLHPLSARLGELMIRLKKGLPLDLEVGRKIPSLLLKAGFQDIHWRVEAYGFQGEELERERTMTAERLGFSHQGVAQVLGSVAEATEFTERYLEEMMRPGAVLFYNKFVVSARTP